MKHLATQPLLELLRPPLGFRTDRALLSAYSADPAVIVAILLALAGRDDDSRGTKVALARTLDDLRGRTTFVLQRGRLAAPRRAPRVLGLLDRFVHEVPWNESARDSHGRSWHAKVALVRTVSENEAEAHARWRLWVGSRNFTRDTSWDIAFSLETVPARSARGTLLPGVDRMASRIAAQAGQEDAWRPLVRELGAARWEVPSGVTPRKVALMLPDDQGRGFPAPPADIERVVAVAPFLDQRSVARLASWTGRKALVSNESELARLNAQPRAQFNNFELLTLPFAPEDGSTPPEDGDTTEEASLDARGLHAKLIWAEHARRATLWLGSPNLTERAWDRNAEAYAEVDVGPGTEQAARALRDGIEAFLEMARPLKAEDLSEAEKDVDEDALEDARAQVAARLSGRQLRAEGLSVVETSGTPHADDVRTTLEVGRIGGGMVAWPRGQVRVKVPLHDAVESELLSIRLSLGERQASWTQCVPYDPPLPEERDVVALRDYLGPRGVLWWIRDILDDMAEGSGGGPWDEEAQSPTPAAKGGAEGAGLPTVEQALRAWTRAPERLESVERIMRGVGRGVRPGDDDKEAQRHLAAFAKSWSVLRRGLGGGQTRGD